jgi:hypothetical protein
MAFDQHLGRPFQVDRCANLALSFKENYQLAQLSLRQIPQSPEGINRGISWVSIFIDKQE